MKHCEQCDQQLVTCGWSYYFHPVILDHFGRTKALEYQCIDAGKNMKIL